MMSEVRLSSAITQFLEGVRLTVAPATLKLDGHYLRQFLHAVGDVPLSSLTPAMVRAWNPKYHPAGVVRRLCSWAKNEARIIAYNPIEGMRTKRNGHRRRILSRAEAVRLLRCSRPAFRRFAVAMIESIARPREIRGVRWGDIRVSGSPAWSPADLAGGRAFFWLDRFKGQEARRERLAARVIPISRRLGRLLVRLWGNGRDAAAGIFANLKGQAWTHNAVRCQFRRLRERAGLPADVGGEFVVAYTLRHTAATDAVGAGVLGLTLAELMGHSDIRMTQRYVHLRPDHLIEASNRLSEWKQGQRAKRDRPGCPRTDPNGDKQ